jgi:hypothetical protein
MSARNWRQAFALASVTVEGWTGKGLDRKRRRRVVLCLYNEAKLYDVASMTPELKIS